MKIVKLLFLLLFLTGCETRMVIVNDVNERDANEIVVFLASKGIPAEKVAAAAAEGAVGGTKEVMWNIRVDAQQATEAMAILNRNGLPRLPEQTLLGLFAQPGLVPTDLQEQIRFQAGLAQQIAGTIRKIDGVIDADVQVSIPPPDSNLPVTAAVYVKHQGVLDNPNSHLVAKIRQLVAASVSGLQLENVTVISDQSRFTNVQVEGKGSPLEEQKDYVIIWSIAVSKDTVHRFQTLFFFLCTFLFLLLAALGWLIWKLLPPLQGLPESWRSLLKPAPFPPFALNPSPPSEVEEQPNG